MDIKSQHVARSDCWYKESDSQLPALKVTGGLFAAKCGV